MKADSSRWHEITPSEFPWEREALDYVREGLPDHEPYRAWSNFEFVADDGSINEVDLLVLAPCGFHLIEIKSWKGSVRGDSGTWVIARDGQSRVEDNPRLLANRKAKKLASLLRRQQAMQKHRLPFLEARVFLSEAELQCHLDQHVLTHVHLRDDAAEAHGKAAGVLAVITGQTSVRGEAPRRVVDKPMAKAVSRAIESAGIRRSQKSRRVGDYLLQDLIEEGATYQDWTARHVKDEKANWRVRIYCVQPGATAELRETVRRAAEREFRILNGVQHAGILRAFAHTEVTQGPALVFEQDPTTQRFDHYLAERLLELAMDVRLGLLRELAEIVQHAHSKRLVHRALCPASILVREPESLTRQLVLFNWQTAGRQPRTTDEGGGASVTATSHLDRLVDNRAAVYMAPEALLDSTTLFQSLDVFSLGAIGFHLLTGQPPASTFKDLTQKLRDGRGLQLSELVNGTPKALQELIQLATHPDVGTRLDSAEEFLEYLDRAEDELTAPVVDERLVSDPGAARKGDVLPGDFVVERRLGQGGVAVALLVKRDGREGVLKVALDPGSNERLREEAQVIQLLQPHQGIVELLDETSCGERAALFLSLAGRETLAERLRKEGRLQLEFLERFGDDLIQVVRYLDEKGVAHRDLKPDNLGVAPIGRGDPLHLVLFDFSLSRTPAENVTAGTPPYLDPFLTDRWNTNAERFAAAMTLHEMAAGTLPVWGDGESHPGVLDCEVTIDPDLFDANLRQGLTAFFRKALARDGAARFDNADEMLHAWRQVFSGLAEPVVAATSEDGEEASALQLERVTLETQVALLGLSTRAFNAMDRLDCVTVADLLRIPLSRIYHLRGVGTKTRREITGLVRELSERFPGRERDARDEESPAAEGGEPAAAEAATIDDVAASLVSLSRGRSPGTAGAQAVPLFLGLVAPEGGEVLSWPSQTDIATALGVTRARVGQVLGTARSRWRKLPAMTRIREEMARLLEAQGFVMTADELSAALLAARGSSQEEPLRSLRARAVVRAALEAEGASAEPRWVARRNGCRLVVARSGETEAQAAPLDGQRLADHAVRLAGIVDRLVDRETLPSPAQALEAVRSASAPPALESVSPERLLHVAAAVSQTAALSSRLELYPSGLPAVRAAKLSRGALLGSELLTPDEVRERVAARYPDAERLPPRPELDQLLSDAGCELVWDRSARQGRGAYKGPRLRDFTTVTSGTAHAERPSRPAPVVLEPEALANTRLFEDKLKHSLSHGGFVALSVPVAHAECAVEGLCRRFGVRVQSVDELLLRHLRQVAEEKSVKWNAVVAADAAGPGGQRWGNLLTLVRTALPKMRDELLGGTEAVLLRDAGLLARYDQMQLLDEFREKVGRANQLPTAWLLLPSDSQAAGPVVDGKAVPVIGPSEWAQVPRGWLAEHGHGRQIQSGGVA